MKLRVTLWLQFVMAHRIDCEHCREPFTYLASGEQMGTAEGGRLVSTKEQLEKLAYKKAMAALLDRAEGLTVAAASCAHCRRLQPSMVVSFWKVFGGLAAVALAVFGGLAVVLVDNRFREIEIACISGVPALICLVLAWRWAARVHTTTDPAPTVSPTSKTDADLVALLAAAEARGEDPLEAWARELLQPRATPPRVINLGVRDSAGVPMLLPDTLLHARRAEALRELC